MKNKNIPRYVIVDTNILFKVAEDPMKVDGAGKKILDYLAQVFKENPGYYPAISSISIFETTDQSSVDSELNHEKNIKGTKFFNVSIRVLRMAGRLGCYYKEIGIGDKQIEIPDKIIAATSAITGSVICTMNPRDYPSPFFIELTSLRKDIQHTGKGGYPVHTHIYFMNPVPNIMKDFWRNRIRPLKEIT